MEFQIPGGTYVNQTVSTEQQIPGYQYINETAAAPAGGATQVRFATHLDGIGSQNTFYGNRLQ